MAGSFSRMVHVSSNKNSMVTDFPALCTGYRVTDFPALEPSYTASPPGIGCVWLKGFCFSLKYSGKKIKKYDNNEFLRNHEGEGSDKLTS